MPNQTLSSSTPTYTFDTTAGADYVLGITGHYGGCRLLLEFSNPNTPTVFERLQAPSSGFPGGGYQAMGSKLRATLLNDRGIPATAAVNVELTAVS